DEQLPGQRRSVLAEVDDRAADEGQEVALLRAADGDQAAPRQRELGGRRARLGGADRDVLLTMFEGPCRGGPEVGVAAEPGEGAAEAQAGGEQGGDGEGRPAADEALAGGGGLVGEHGAVDREREPAAGGAVA